MGAAAGVSTTAARPVAAFARQGASGASDGCSSAGCAGSTLAAPDQTQASHAKASAVETHSNHFNPGGDLRTPSGPASVWAYRSGTAAASRARSASAFLSASRMYDISGCRRAEAR